MPIPTGSGTVPLIQMVINYLSSYGTIEGVVVGHGADLLVRYLKDIGFEGSIIIQRRKEMEGAMLDAHERLGGDLFFAAVDAFLVGKKESIASFLKELWEKRPAVAVAKFDDVSRVTEVVERDGVVVQMRRKEGNARRGIGIALGYLITSDLISSPHQREWSLLKAYVDRKVPVVPVPEDLIFCDVGVPKDYVACLTRLRKIL